MDIIKYTPLQFRSSGSFVTPKGPNFLSAKPVACNLAGSQLRFNAPRHRPGDSSSISIEPKGDSLLDFPFRSFRPHIMQDDNWRQSVFFARSWGFNGPWFTGRLGLVDMTVQALKCVKPKNDASFFHPRAFEQGIAEYLTSLLGHRTSQGKPGWLAPLNWQPMLDFPVPAARFDLVSGVGEPPRQACLFPVSHDCLIEIGFTVHQLCEGSQKDKDENVSSVPMLALVDDIVDSLVLSLSEDAEEQLTSTATNPSDMRVTDCFAPLKWS